VRVACALWMVASVWWLLVKLVPILGLFGEATTGCHVMSSWSRAMVRRSELRRANAWHGLVSI
jgi:hypothetical protein